LVGVQFNMDGKSPATDLDELLQHSGWIRNLAYANLRDHALAEDVTQEVLLKALAAPRRSGRLLGAWLKAVTVNTARNELRGSGRRRAREQKVALPEGYELDSDQDDVIGAFHKLTGAVESLSQSHRNIIALRFYKSYTFQQIAVQLGVSESHARVKLHRALKQLREAMERRDCDWRANCLLLAPAAGLMSTPLALPGTTKLLALVSVVILVGVGLLWRPTVETRSTYLPSSEVHTDVADASGMPTSQASVLQRTDFLPELPTINSSNASAVGQIQDLEMLVLLHGHPVPGARVVIFQDGQLHNTTTNEGGRFALRVDPDRIFGLSVVAENAARSSGTTFYRATIDLDEIKSDTSSISFHVYPEGAEGQAHIRVFVDWTAVFGTAPPRRQFLELVAEGDVSLAETFQVPGWVPLMNTVVEVTADGFLPVRDFITGFWNGSGDIRVEVYAGDIQPIRLVDLGGAPLAFVDIMQGFPCLDIEQTDADGVLPSIGPGWIESSVGAMLKALVVKLKDGRFWASRAGDFEANFVTYGPDFITIKVDESPILVKLEVPNLPEGNTVEVASAKKNFSAALLKSSHSGSGMFSSEEFLGFPWTSIEPAQTVELEKGMIGPGAAVYARLQPLGWYIGKFPIKDARAVVRAELCDLRVSFLGLEQYAPGSLFVELKQDTRFMDFAAATQRISIDGADLEIALPAGGEFSLRLLEKTGGGFASLALAECDRGIYQVRIDGKEMFVELEVLPQELRKTLIRVDGSPAIKGLIGSATISLDGEAVLPYGPSGLPLWRGASLVVAATPRIAEGEAAQWKYSNQTFPGEFSALADGRMVWDLQLATVELMVPAAKNANKRYLQKILYSSDPHSSGERSLQNPECYLSISVSPSDWGRATKIPQQGGVIRFSAPIGRYYFKIGWGRNWDLTYGLENGVAVENGILNIFSPD